MNCRHGLFYHYDSDRTIGSHLRTYGEWAEEEIFLLSRLIRVGATVVDVGANIGTHAIPFARLVGRTGTVIAIDPQTAVIPLLTMNVIVNGLVERVRIVQCLADSSEEPSFSSIVGKLGTVGNFGSNTFVGVKAEANSNPDALIPTIRVPIDMLGLAACDLIKIDVQGFEPDVLKGALETIRRFKPVIYYEQMGSRNHNAISEMLGQLGYRLYMHTARPYNRSNFNNVLNLFGRNTEINVLALPAECEEQVTASLLASDIPIQPLTAPGLLEPDPNVDGIWTLPSDAYVGTLLYGGPEAQPDTWLSRPIPLPDTLSSRPAWSSLKWEIEDLEKFIAITAEAGTLGAHEADINLQVHVYANDEPTKRYWNSFLIGHQMVNREVPDFLPLRLTKSSLTQGQPGVLRGMGTIELRFKSARHYELALRNVAIASHA
jgi:FkbM family methyltransferase